MTHAIIFPRDGGGIVIGYVADKSTPIAEIARKDVPAGKPYLLVPDEQLPRDHTFFDAFEADFSNPDGYGTRV